MTSCPACGKTVDPLRAPAVGVRDGRVVSYCSRECAASLDPTQASRNESAVTPATLGSPRQGENPSRETHPGEAAVSDPVSVSGGNASTTAPIPSAVVSGAPLLPRDEQARVQPRAMESSAPAQSPTHAARTEPAIPLQAVPRVTETARSTRVARAEVQGQGNGVAVAPPPALRAAERATANVVAARRGRLARIAATALVVAVGGGLAVNHLGYLEGSRNDAPDRAPAAQGPAPFAIDAAMAASAPTAAEAVGKARDVLAAALTSESARVQRIAASALARTGAPEAMAALNAAVAKETSDLAKLDMQYALARGGDPRGLEALVAALSASRRDIRLEAGRRLALLGDKRAIDTLVQYLDVSQLRLGAAEQLAYVAEPRAVRVLEAVQADPKATLDDKARAAIALGHAGKAEVAPQLRKLLGDARFNAFAAASLAHLHDQPSDAVRSLLVAQLGITSLRVAAARALRTLDPNLDPIPLLHALIDALASAKDTEQVAAAEAILILAGPPAWSQRE